MIALLITAASWAAEPPPRPDAPSPHPAQCGSVVGVDVGDPAPPAVFVSGAATCAALVVPISDYQDLLNTETWAKQVADRYRLDTAALEFQVGWYQGELARVTEPVPFWQRPGTIVGIGATVGAGGVLVAAWSLQLVED